MEKHFILVLGLLIILQLSRTHDQGKAFADQFFVYIHEAWLFRQLQHCLSDRDAGQLAVQHHSTSAGRRGELGLVVQGRVREAHLQARRKLYVIL